jgi:PAS domain S-box-containing protein
MKMLQFSSSLKFFALIVYIAIFFLLLKSRTDKRVKQLFLLYVLGLVVWQLSSLLVNISVQPAVVLIWYNLQFSSLGLQSIIFFPLTRAFLTLKKQRVLTAAAYITCVFTIALGVSGFAVREVVPGRWGYFVPVLNETIYLMSLAAYFFWGCGVFNLLRSLLREQVNLQRNRIRYLLLGAVVIMAGMAANFTSLQDYPVDIVCAVINALLMAYAVLRYRLLAIKIVLKRSLVAMLTLTAITGIYVLVSLLAVRLLESSTHFWPGLAGFFTVLASLLVFRKSILHDLIRPIYNQTSPIHETVLTDYSHAIRGVLDLEELMRLIVQTAANTMTVDRAFLLYRRRAEDIYTVAYGVGLESGEQEGLSLQPNHPFTLLLQKQAVPLWREEIKINPAFRDLRTISEPVFQLAGVSVIVPLIQNNELIAVLNLGEKSTGELYNNNELRFLSTLGHLTSASFSAAFHHEEVQRRLAEQTLLFVLSETMVRSLGIREAMTSAVRMLKNFLNADFCLLTLPVGSSPFCCSSSPSISDAMIESITEQVAGITERSDVERVYDVLLRLRDVERPELRGLLYMPIDNNGEHWATLVLGRISVEPQTEHKATLYRTIKAILNQGFILHHSISDLINFKLYNEHIVNSISVSGEMFFVTDPQGKILRINQPVNELLGYSESDILGTDIHFILAPAEEDGPESSPAKSILQQVIRNSELNISTRSGRTLPVLVSSSPVRDTEQRLQEIVVLARDITKLRAAESVRRESEEKYRSLFERVQDTVITCDLQGRIVNLNPAGEVLLGIAAGEDENTLASDFFTSPEEFPRLIQALREKELIRDYEIQLTRHDGEELVVLLTASLMFDENRSPAGFRGIMHNITEQRDLQRQLFQAQKMESIGTLAGGIAHDFNNILTVILGYTTLIRTEAPPSDPLLDHVQVIEASTRRAVDLTSQLLSFSRAGVTDIAPVNLNRVVGDTCKLIRETFDRSIVINTDLNGEIPLILGDENQVHQIIMNLCVNARDAMPTGGRLQLKTDVRILEQETPGSTPGTEGSTFVSLAISDSGTGIDERILSKIFDPFFTTKKPGEGTGLGLSVVYGVVKKLGGFINVCNNSDRGTTFEIFFLPSGKIQNTTGEPEGEPAPLMGGKETILIVDDEENIRRLLQRILSHRGYEVLEAADGQEALDLLAQRNGCFDLAIIDMIMPNMGGEATCRRLRALYPDIKVLMATGYSDSERIREIRDLGVEGLLKKPYHPNLLLETVRATLDASRDELGRL